MGNGVVVVNAGTTDVDITNNKFNTGISVIAFPGTITNAAIVLFNPTAQTVDATVSGNAIKRFRYGVWFTNVEGSNQFIFDNTMNFQQLTTNATGGAIHYGVRLQGCDNTVVDENKIGKPGINPTLAVADEIRGISVENSTDCQISENVLTKMGTGVYCEDNLMGSIVVCNDFKKCFYGIEFDNTSIGNHLTGGLAQQNEWINMIGGGLDIEANIVSGPIEFWYRPGGTFDPNPFVDLGASFTLPHPSLTADPTDVCATLFSPGPIEKRESNIGAIVRNDLVFTSNSSENAWLTCNYAYNEMEKDTTWLALGTTDDVDYQNFHSMIDGGNIGTLKDINDLAEDGDIPNAQMLNSSLVDTCNMDYNQKALNTLYLNTWAQGQFQLLGTDSLQLWDVALLDPATAGLGVYGARVMLFTDVELPNERITIAEQVSTTTESGINVSVYPNPTNGIVYFEYDLPFTNTNVKVYDLTGNLVVSIILKGEVGTQPLDLNSLSNGLYHYVITSDSEILETGKLVINQ